MKYLVLVSALLLTACSEGTYVPDNANAIATEMCKDLDGVRTLHVHTYLKNQRFCVAEECGKMITEFTIRCNKYDTEMKRTLEWSRPYN